VSGDGKNFLSGSAIGGGVAKATVGGNVNLDGEFFDERTGAGGPMGE